MLSCHDVGQCLHRLVADQGVAAATHWPGHLTSRTGLIGWESKLLSVSP
jgi:hypothetical protein